MSSDLLLGFHPENGKGKLTLAKREMFFGFIFLKPLLNVPKEESKLSGSLAVLEGKGVRWDRVCPRFAV